MTNVVDLAYQIIDMQTELKFLRRENKRLMEIEEQYNDFVQGSINHSQVMLGGMLKLVMKPGVIEALSKNGEK